ncbi:MAG: alkaline phosphatase [Bryobacteraceae bacterium]|nr:alkaline phosphatase [Bryobacteraceae bacterium]MDW8377844.1 alkaline phosphatase [Bryobacterales bacterium]
MKIFLLFGVLLTWSNSAWAERRAKNVILLLADAGGIPTLHAASVHGYKATRKLFVQSMPYLGLSDTSTASQWVSDSAAGMTAIVTGVKTHNGVLSQDATAVRGKSDGVPLKTILEYAEERGLSTGIITSQPFFDATPAACYAQVNDRRATAKILEQFLKPRFGDGVDILVGAGRKQALAAVPDFLDRARQKYTLADSPTSLGDQKRVLAIVDGPFELSGVLQRTIDLLSKNRKGYFLMVEWDAHTDQIRAGLDRLLEFDRAIRQTAQRPDMKDTLLLFTADHSFDLRVVGGLKKDDLLSTPGAIKVDGSHSGEEVLVAAQGPGASQVRGYLDNTDLFRIMMKAFGWRVGP